LKTVSQDHRTDRGQVEEEQGPSMLSSSTDSIAIQALICSSVLSDLSFKCNEGTSLRWLKNHSCPSGQQRFLAGTLQAIK